MSAAECRRGRPRLGSAPVGPCARCGGSGAARADCPSPRRYSGAPFGVDGKVCHCCYQNLKGRSPASRPPIGPCARCGNPAGQLHPATGRPWRFDGAPFGLEGRICRGCRSKYLRDSRTRKAPARDEWAVPAAELARRIEAERARRREQLASHAPEIAPEPEHVAWCRAMIEAWHRGPKARLAVAGIGEARDGMVGMAEGNE